MEKPNQEKRKADPKLVKAFINKSKKARLSTYTFEKADPSIVTPHKKMKDVTLTQMKDEFFETPLLPPTKQITKKEDEICCW